MHISSLLSHPLSCIALSVHLVAMGTTLRALIRGVWKQRVYIKTQLPAFIQINQVQGLTASNTGTHKLFVSKLQSIMLETRPVWCFQGFNGFITNRKHSVGLLEIGFRVERNGKRRHNMNKKQLSFLCTSYHIQITKGSFTSLYNHLLYNRKGILISQKVLINLL